MTDRLEPAICSGRSNQRVEGSLLLTDEVDILDLATTDAHEMGMMTRQRLGEFETGHSACSMMRGDNAGAFQHSQVAV